MKEITFEATFEVPHKQKHGLMFKDADGNDLHLIISQDWARYFELHITRQNTQVELPYPLAFSLAPALESLGVEVVRAELTLKQMGGDNLLFAVLVLKSHEGEPEVTLQTRTSEAVMICLQANKPIYAHESFLWHCAPRTFFEEISPQDFVTAYQKRKGISP